MEVGKEKKKFKEKKKNVWEGVGIYTLHTLNKKEWHYKFVFIFGQLREKQTGGRSEGVSETLWSRSSGILNKTVILKTMGVGGVTVGSEEGIWLRRMDTKGIPVRGINK